jgi:hypothetical protein
MIIMRGSGRRRVLVALMIICQVAWPPEPSNLSPYQSGGRGRRFKYVCPVCGRYRKLRMIVQTPPKCRFDGARMVYTPVRKQR